MLEYDSNEDKLRLLGFFMTVALFAGFALAILTNGAAGVTVFFAIVAAIFMIVGIIGTLVSAIVFLMNWLD